MVRHGDDQWFDIAQWTVFALFAGEEMGINQANVDTFTTSDDPNVKLLLGQEGEMGAKLGLSNVVGLRHHQTSRELRGHLQPQPRPRHSHESPARPQ